MSNYEIMLYHIPDHFDISDNEFVNELTKSSPASCINL